MSSFICFSILLVKCVLLPNDQQGGPFLPQCLQLSDASLPGYQIGTLSNIAVILSCLQQLKFLSPCRQALQLFLQQPRQKVTVNTNTALVRGFHQRGGASSTARTMNPVSIFCLPRPTYHPGDEWEQQLSGSSGGPLQECLGDSVRRRLGHVQCQCCVQAARLRPRQGGHEHGLLRLRVRPHPFGQRGL